VRAHELPEDAARHLLQSSRPATARAGDRLGSRLHTVAAAGRARHRHVEGHLHLGTARRLAELDLDGGADVGSAPATTPTTAEDVVAEERREEIAQTAHVELRRLEAAGAKPGVPVAVVEGARLGARQHLVRLRHLAKAQLGLRLRRHVRVQLPGEATECLLDRRVVRVAGDAEQLVVVAVGRRHDQSSP